MKQPNVMATVSDLRCTPEFVAAMRRAGMDSVRINSAHVTPDVFRRMVNTIRSVDSAIGILMDTKGPEMRTTELPAELTLAPGDKLKLRAGEEASSADCVHVKVSELGRYVKPGQVVLLDDGDISLAVTEVAGEDIIAEVTAGGVLGSRKTVAFPGMKLPPLPAVSPKDREMIEVAVECGIDMIAHSFVRSAADVEAVRELIDGSGITLYAKVECSEALDNLAYISRSADGLLVARGDLGSNIPLEEVPTAQFRTVERAREDGKPVILATQILQSMLTKPAPTRAELSDITLAVLQGVDTLLLCGETAQGNYPCECVEIMKRTIHKATELPWRISKTI